MLRRWIPTVFAGAFGLVLWAGSASSAQAQLQGFADQAPQLAGQAPPTVYYPLQRQWYYPYYYFPHNYWPTMGPRWPEPVGAPYQRPPAYMAYPPFKEPNWRYENWEAHHYHRGFHFWLDQF